MHERHRWALPLYECARIALWKGVLVGIRGMQSQKGPCSVLETTGTNQNTRCGQSFGPNKPARMMRSPCSCSRPNRIMAPPFSANTTGLIFVSPSRVRLDRGEQYIWLHRAYLPLISTR